MRTIGFGVVLNATASAIDEKARPSGATGAVAVVVVIVVILLVHRQRARVVGEGEVMVELEARLNKRWAEREQKKDKRINMYLGTVFGTLALALLVVIVGGEASSLGALLLGQRGDRAAARVSGGRLVWWIGRSGKTLSGERRCNGRLDIGVFVVGLGTLLHWKPGGLGARLFGRLNGSKALEATTSASGILLGGGGSTGDAGRRDISVVLLWQRQEK